MVKGDTPSNKRSIQSPDSAPTAKKTQMEPSTEVGKMNINELMTAMSDLLDSKLEHLATKEDVKKELEIVREENKQLTETVNKLRDHTQELQTRMTRLENLNRRNNLIFSGIPHPTSNNALNVIKFCEDVLEIKNLSIVRGNFLGSPRKNVMIVEFSSPMQVNSILSKGNLLKGSKISISRDYSKEVRIKRSILFRIKKKLLALNDTVKVAVKGVRIDINGQEYSEEDNKLISHENADPNQLNGCFSQDVSILFSDINSFITNKTNESESVE